MRKICVATATRAEYGLLKPLMEKIRSRKDFQLQVLATGAHLSPEFGLTYKSVEEDGFQIDEKVEMLLSADTSTSIVKSMGLGMIGFADALLRLGPDAIVILGDRYEMLALASSATIFNIPIIHLHGGEITEGAYDDSIRHAITKLSMIHFTSTEAYRKRVIQMGENPNRVFNVGAIGLDNIQQMILLNKAELEHNLGVKFKKYNYQVTFHPETLGEVGSEAQFEVLLRAIDQQEDSFFIFTKANADTDGRVINTMIDNYVREHPHKAIAYTTLGSLKFLSLVSICDAIVGNSSSGIIEAPSLKTATINIGNRQQGRTQAKTVINVPVDERAILSAFDHVKQDTFKQEVKVSSNPYGSGDSAQKILEVIASDIVWEGQFKKFYDIS